MPGYKRRYGGYGGMRKKRRVSSARRSRVFKYGRRSRSAPARFTRSVGARRRSWKSVGGVMSPTRWVKSVYVDCVSDTNIPVFQGSALTVNNNLIWRCNSVYDPKYAVAGVFNLKATGHGFYSNMYNKYAVVSATCVVDIKQQEFSGPTTAKPITFCLLVDDNAFISNNQLWTNYVQDKEAVYGTFTPNRSVTARLRLKKKFVLSQLTRGGKKAYNDSNYQSLISGNPAIQWYFMLTYMYTDGVSGVINSDYFTVNCRIYYNVVYMQPKDIDNIPGMVEQ